MQIETKIDIETNVHSKLNLAVTKLQGQEIATHRFNEYKHLEEDHKIIFYWKGEETGLIKYDV